MPHHDIGLTQILKFGICALVSHAIQPGRFGRRNAIGAVFYYDTFAFRGFGQFPACKKIAGSGLERTNSSPLVICAKYVCNPKRSKTFSMVCRADEEASNN